MSDTSLSFMGDAAKRLRCRLDIGNREFDAQAAQAEAGGACADCPGCDQPLGEMGLAGDCRIEADGRGGLQLQWNCPICNRLTVEETTSLSATRDAAQVAADPLCHRCRTRAAEQLEGANHG